MNRRDYAINSSRRWISCQLFATMRSSEAYGASIMLMGVRASSKYLPRSLWILDLGRSMCT